MHRVASSKLSVVEETGGGKGVRVDLGVDLQVGGGLAEGSIRVDQVVGGGRDWTMGKGVSGWGARGYWCC